MAVLYGHTHHKPSELPDIHRTNFDWCPLTTIAGLSSYLAQTIQDQINMIATIFTNLTTRRGKNSPWKFVPCLIIIAACSPVMAQNCKKAKGISDKLLCSDMKFRIADQEMADAYFQLLRSTFDRDMREGIIASQRRWIKERDKGVPPVNLSNNASIDEETKAEHKAMFDATKDREHFLRQRTKDGSQNAIVATMARQKKDLSTFPGGDTQGFTAECGFLPHGFGNGYSCEEVSISAQKGNRVCTRSREWASGHITNISIVSRVVGGKIKQMGICKNGYDSNFPECPDFSQPAAWVLNRSTHNDVLDVSTGWDTSSRMLDFIFGSTMKVDPDITYNDGDLNFLHECIDAKIIQE